MKNLFYALLIAGFTFCNTSQIKAAATPPQSGNVFLNIKEPTFEKLYAKSSFDPKVIRMITSKYLYYRANFSMENAVSLIGDWISVDDFIAQLKQNYVECFQNLQTGLIVFIDRNKKKFYTTQEDGQRALDLFQTIVQLELENPNRKTDEQCRLLGEDVTEFDKYLDACEREVLS